MHSVSSFKQNFSKNYCYLQYQIIYIGFVNFNFIHIWPIFIPTQGVYSHLSHALKNTANQWPGEPSYIMRYPTGSIPPSFPEMAPKL